MTTESNVIQAMNQNPVWQTAIWRKGDKEVIRRFNLRDNDGYRNLRNLLLWAAHVGVTVVMIPRFVTAEEANAEILRIRHII